VTGCQSKSKHPVPHQKAELSTGRIIEEVKKMNEQKGTERTENAECRNQNEEGRGFGFQV
jgi:hypothetical protein